SVPFDFAQQYDRYVMSVCPDLTRHVVICDRTWGQESTARIEGSSSFVRNFPNVFGCAGLTTLARPQLRVTCYANWANCSRKLLICELRLAILAEFRLPAR